MEAHNQTYSPFNMGVLLSVYVSKNDQQAKNEAERPIWCFLRNCLEGHLRKKGKSMTLGPGVPSQSLQSWEAFLKITAL